MFYIEWDVQARTQSLILVGNVYFLIY